VIPTLSLRNPVDLLAAVPYLLGFHPADSVVVLGMTGPRLIFQARADLVAQAGELADQLTVLLARQGFDTVLLVGYGPAERVDPVVVALRERLAEAGIETPEALRAAAGRYWSYTCSVPTCCPPEGTPYTVDASTIAAEATVAGMVALPSREALRARLAPVTGAEREAMREATARADRRARELVDAALAEVPAAIPVDRAGASAVRAARRRFQVAGRIAVDRAVATHRAGRVLDDDAAAWLSVLLVHLPVRDHAWESIGQDFDVHLALWTDLTRRAEPDLRAGPATLLAFTAWRAGEGATSTIALELALESDPQYPMAQLLGRAITLGLNPAQWRGPARPRLTRRTRRRPP
jgi:hypothetical protein